ncbi:hypothetical protein FRX31_009270 [Thalictrum thalictroides]|uniref:Programmed cell death protein 4-like n=1 Tax=Thalictrum thalictroides TaxID=46969 RepID=A0A7J6WUP4_THATH|nr:hypothetical protein FRX31_009270 [Thalictrum thalictroides]
MKETGKSVKKTDGKQQGNNSGRKDRRSASGMNGSAKKGGHGGKFTWVGSGQTADQLEKDIPVALDFKDPNFEDPPSKEEDDIIVAK